MDEYKITENRDKSPLPEWIGAYMNVTEKFILANNCNLKDCFSSSKGEYVRYDITFTDIGMDIFVAIMRLDDGIYYHIDCQMITPDKMKTKEGTSTASKLIWEIWMFKLPFRVAMNGFGGLSLSSVGRLGDISKEYFKMLIYELTPASEYLLKRHSNNFKMSNSQ